MPDGELQKAMDEIKESTTAVSAAVEESAKGIVNVAEMSTDLTGSVGDIQKAADHNNEIADLIKKYADELKSEVMADNIMLGEMAGYTKEWNINGEDVVFGVAKVTK